MAIPIEYLIAILFAVVAIIAVLLIWFNPWGIVWKILQIIPIHEQDC